MTDSRENWTSRSGFIIAAVGSAVGLGNIWRFPYVAYENGGGAFLIPYLLALITAGLPLLFLDYAVGHRSTGSPPSDLSFCLKQLQRLHRKSHCPSRIHLVSSYYKYHSHF